MVSYFLFPITDYPVIAINLIVGTFTIHATLIAASLCINMFLIIESSLGMLLCYHVLFLFLTKLLLC